MSRVLELLPYILPPLLGAVIGYVTNTLAIRMLFRPLQEWRIAGIRVPLTPGIIPRRRHDLAESIGRMVSNRLLTPEILRERIESASFADSLKDAVISGLDRLFAVRLSVLEQTWRASYLSERAIGFVLGGGRAEKIVAAIISAAGESPAAIVAGLTGDARIFRDPERLLSLFDSLYDPLTDQIEGLLRRPGVRAQLYRHGRVVLAFAVDQLSSFQRFMVSAGQYDRQLELRMPVIVDRTIDEIQSTLKADATRRAIREHLRALIESHRDDSLEEVIHGWSGLPSIRDLAARFVPSDPEEIAEALVRGGNSPIAQRVGEKLGTWLLAQDDRTISDLFGGKPAIPDASLAVVAKLGQFLVLRGIEPFFAQVNLYETVVQRIDSLDVEQVESLLLGIIRQHLRWINVFGAILGALIGGIQVVLSLIGVSR